jgi:hypothetical protein
MAPEQVLGREIDGRADLYSVGVVLYRLLTGQLPFKADTAISMVQMQISEPPTPIVTFRPDLPPWCTAIVDRALAKSPFDRFQGAEEFRGALMSAVTPQALGEMPTLSTPTPPGLALDMEMTVPHRTPTAMRASSAMSAVPPLATNPGAVTSPVRPAVATVRPPTPLPEKTTTVVLGRTHLITLAALLVIVAAGIGVLAFAAFRGGRSALLQTATENATGATPPAATVESAAAAVPPPEATIAVPSPPPAPSAAPQPAPPKGPASGAAVGQPTAGGERGVATAGAGPGAAKTAERGTGTGVSPGGSPVGGRTAAPDPATTSEPAPAAAAPPPVPVVPAVTFNQVRLLVAEGDRVREREGVLTLADGQVSIVTPGGNAPIMSVANSSLSGIFYARSKQPRWRDASGQTVESKIDLGRLGFLRSERNWVILLTGGEPVIFRIEDSALRTVLPALQERTGKAIQR